MKIKFPDRSYSAALKFIITGLLLYLAWILVYESFIKPLHWIDPWLTNLVSSHSVALLRIAGFDTSHKMTETGNIIFGGYSRLLRIAYLCDGLILYVIFLIFMIAFPGPAVHKTWFIPAGFLLIYMVNLGRVVALIIIEIKAREYLAFNHKYSFTLLVYGFIFFLWFLWIRYFSGMRKESI